MSKAQLKKVLLQMDAEQMRELILEVYDVSKEGKAYLEYFLNPDVEKLKAKFEQNVKKEFNRTKWGYSKARSSVLKKLLKEFEAYQPGFEAVLGARRLIFFEGLKAETYLHMTESLENWLGVLLVDIVGYADRNQYLQKILPEIEALISTKGLGTRAFRAQLREKLQEGLQELGI